MQINHIILAEQCDRIFHGVCIQVAHNQDIAVAIEGTIFLVVLDNGLCLSDTIAIKFALSIALIGVIAATATTFGFEVVDRQ